MESRLTTSNPPDRASEVSNPKAEPASSLNWRDFREEDRPAWIKWLEQTYQGTADCPLLNGIRSTDATLDGYLAAAKLPLKYGSERRLEVDSSPSWEAAFWGEGQEAGIVAGYILSPTDSTTWELTYMGVVPGFRGRRLGQALLGRAFDRIRQQNGRKMWLAVDVANRSAIDIYRRFGFAEMRRLEAWIVGRNRP